MSITVQDLATLDQTAVDDNLSNLLALIASLNPTVDLKRGTFRSLLATLSATLATANQTTIDKVRQSNSLLAIEDDPTLADDGVLDRLASNYLITRTAGAKASGTVTIVLSTLTTTVISGSAVFTANGRNFSPNKAYIGRTDASVVASDSDVLISAVGDGTYALTIPVSDSTDGSDGNLLRGTIFTTTEVIPSFVKAYASSNFSGGKDTETNTELQARLKNGPASKTLSNRLSIDALIKNNFSDVIATSTIGYADEEMRRYHSVLPVSFGGRVDVYVRTQPLWESQVITPKTAILVAKTVGNRGTWQINLSRDEVPGFYEIDKITTIANAGVFGAGYAVLSDIRSYDVTTNTGAAATNSTTFIPDIAAATEAAYSRYQTAVIQFADTDTDTSTLVVGNTASYAVSFKILPNLTDIQDLVADKDVRHIGTDCLIKAPIPAFTSVSLTINVLRGTVSPTISTIQNLVADVINATGFSNTLSATKVSAAVQAVLASTATVSSISLTSRLRKSDGSAVTVTSNVAATFSDDPVGMASAKTICFFTAPSEVAVTLNTVDS